MVRSPLDCRRLLDLSIRRLESILHGKSVYPDCREGAALGASLLRAALLQPLALLQLDKRRYLLLGGNVIDPASLCALDLSEGAEDLPCTYSTSSGHPSRLISLQDLVLEFSGKISDEWPSQPTCSCRGAQHPGAAGLWQCPVWQHTLSHILVSVEASESTWAEPAVSLSRYITSCSQLSASRLPVNSHFWLQLPELPLVSSTRTPEGQQVTRKCDKCSSGCHGSWWPCQVTAYEGSFCCYHGLPHPEVSSRRPRYVLPTSKFIPAFAICHIGPEPPSCGEAPRTLLAVAHSSQQEQEQQQQQVELQGEQQATMQQGHLLRCAQQPVPSAAHHQQQSKRQAQEQQQEGASKRTRLERSSDEQHQHQQQLEELGAKQLQEGGGDASGSQGRAEAGQLGEGLYHMSAESPYLNGTAISAEQQQQEQEEHRDGSASPKRRRLSQQPCQQLQLEDEALLRQQLQEISGAAPHLDDTVRLGEEGGQKKLPMAEDGQQQQQRQPVTHGEQIEPGQGQQHQQPVQAQAEASEWEQRMEVDLGVDVVRGEKVLPRLAESSEQRAAANVLLEPEAVAATAAAEPPPPAAAAVAAAEPLPLPAAAAEPPAAAAAQSPAAAAQPPAAGGGASSGGLPPGAGVDKQNSYTAESALCHLKQEAFGELSQGDGQGQQGRGVTGGMHAARPSRLKQLQQRFHEEGRADGVGSQGSGGSLMGGRSGVSRWGGSQGARAGEVVLPLGKALEELPSEGKAAYAVMKDYVKACMKAVFQIGRPTFKITSSFHSDPLCMQKAVYAMLVHAAEHKDSELVQQVLEQLEESFDIDQARAAGVRKVGQ